MWLETAVWIDLRRWKRQHLLLDNRRRRSFEDAEEETDVADRVLDIGVGWHDEKNCSLGEPPRSGRHRQRAYRGGRAADAPEGGLQPRFPKNASQQ